MIDDDVGLTIRLPKYLRSQLAQICKEKGCSISFAVRQLIIQFVDENPKIDIFKIK
ncbi:MAG: hypothetical protein Q4A74_08725 [Cardiobacteriaceae bacterium]|nr:hypothetical protein [Cardiobacteriaceae bacterium]